jgi:hypothetical protein
MADPVINQFEIERRVITWSPLTTLNDGITPLGYDGDPNLVNPVGTPGEQWLYSVPIGQFYKQSDATLWWKNGSPNSWVELVGGGGGASIEGTFSTATVGVRDAVYISSASTVDQAIATVPLGEKPTIGICISKPSATTAVVQYAGEVGVFSGSLVAGDTYYLDTVAGQLTNNISGHGSGTVIRVIGVAKTTSVLVLQPQPGVVLT